MVATDREDIQGDRERRECARGRVPVHSRRGAHHRGNVADIAEHDEAEGRGGRPARRPQGKRRRPEQAGGRARRAVGGAHVGGIAAVRVASLVCRRSLSLTVSPVLMRREQA